MKNGWEGKGNHCCESGNAVVSSILEFAFIFAFKETSGRPEVSRRHRVVKQSHYMVVRAIELYESVRKYRTQAKQMP